MIKTKIRKVGNSAGVILSKDMLRQADIEEMIHIEISKQKIIITPVQKNPRAGWKEQLIDNGAAGDKALLPENITNKFDEDEWAW